MSLALVSSTKEEWLRGPEIAICPGRAEHIRELATTLRYADKQEIVKFGITPQAALWNGFRGSTMCRAALIDGKLAAVWGVKGVILGSVGHPWLLTSDVVSEISPIRFARIYARELEEMLEHYPKLFNYVDAEYLEAVRLLDIVGFKIGPPEPLGRYGAIYRKFEMER